MNLFFQIVQLLIKFPGLQKIRLIFYFFDSLILFFIKRPKKNINARKEKIIIFFTHGLGDCAMFCSAIDYIKESFPEDKYELTLSCNSKYKDLFKNKIKKILSVDYQKTSINPLYRIKFLKKMREEYYDIAIDPFSCDECFPNVFAMNAICADKKIGALITQRKKYQCPKWLRNKIYDEIIFIKEFNLHKNKHYAKFFSELTHKNIKPVLQKIPYEKTLQLPQKYIVVYPSASIDAKRWPIERFAEITRKIVSKTACSVVCLGTKNDEDITLEFINKIRSFANVENLLEKTSVMQLVEVLGRAAFVLTNDTSIFHLAVGTETKVCVVSGGYAYSTFLNYSSNDYGKQIESRIKIIAHKSECMDCNNFCNKKFKKCYPCVDEVTVDEVWNEVMSLMG